MGSKILSFFIALFIFSTNFLVAQQSTKATAADISILLLSPGAAAVGDYVNAAVTYTNTGGDLISGSLTFTVSIKDANGTEVYSVTKSGSYTLYTNDVKYLVFTDAWQPSAEGDYTLTVTIDYADDADASDNTKTIDLFVRDFTYEPGYLYGYILNDAGDNSQGHLAKINLNNNQMPTTILANTDADVYAGDYINNRIMFVDVNSDLWYLNGDGSAYKVAKITGVDGTIYAFNYNQEEGKYYALTYDFSSQGSYAYEIDTSKFQATQLTQYTGGNMYFGLITKEDNSMYAIEAKATIDNTTIYFDYGTVNTFGPSAGVITQIATTDLIVGSVQDYTYDTENKMVIGTGSIYNENDANPDHYAVFKLDLSNGHIDELYSSVDFKYQLGFCAVTPGVSIEPTAIAENDLGVKVYPNPTTGKITINADNAVAEIYDFKGKMVYKADIKSNNQTIDLSAMPKGIYLLKLRTEGQVVSKKIVLK